MLLTKATPPVYNFGIKIAYVTQKFFIIFHFGLDYDNWV